MAEVSNTIVTTSTSKSSSSVRSRQTAVLRDVAVEAKSTSSRTFGTSMNESLKQMTSIDALLDYIATERLRLMPHRGSKFDRVLAYAAYFASQTQLFYTATEEFVSHSGEAANIIWANIHLLLQMGPEHVDTLESLFVVYYALGQVFSSIVQYQDLFMSSAEVRSLLSYLYSDVLQLVVGTASQFGQTRILSSTALSSEIYRSYGTVIAGTHSRKDQIFNLLWETSVTSEAGINEGIVELESWLHGYNMFAAARSAFNIRVCDYCANDESCPRILTTMSATTLFTFLECQLGPSRDTFVTHQTNPVKAYSVDIETIRDLLAPSDRIVRSLTLSTVGSVGARGARAEHTCEWMRPHLMEFIRSSEKVMVIQGKPGTGKTYLSGWIAEHLQRVEGRKVHHDTVSFSIERDVSTQTSIIAVAKGLLLQILERNVGNLDFYRVLSDLIEVSRHAKSTEEIEQAIWRAVDSGLAKLSNMMIIVDGLDQINGGETSGLKLLEKLNQITANHANVRAIALSQPLTKAAPQHTRSFTIEPSYTVHDIHHQIDEALAAASEFRSIKHSDKERISRTISTAADGSFVFAVYSLEILKRESTASGIMQKLDNLPKTIQEALTKLQALLDLQNHDTRSLVAWLLTAQRPLTLSEIKAFLEIDLGSCSHKPRYSDIERDVTAAVGPIVTISNGTIRFKHDTLRTHLMAQAASVKDYSNTGPFPFMLKEAHFDLTSRCLAYSKLFVTRRADLSFESLETQVLSDLYQQHVAFEYSATYWLSHFYQSPMYDANGKHKLVHEFRNCFPDSTLLVQAEGAIWPTRNPTDFEVALKIRQTILGPQTLVILQNIITLARSLELISPQKALPYYYQAYTLTITLLGEDARVLTKIATAYLESSTTVTITEKNETTTQREAMLKRVISVYKDKYGASHSTTVKYTRMLAQLYTDTKQFDLATTVWQEVYEIYVQIYGEFHAETTATYKTLETTLKQSSKKEDIKTLTRSRYETTQKDLSVTEKRRTTTDEEMVDYYENRKEYGKAESVLVDQWRSVSESASASRDVSVHKRKLDITKKYIEFLKRQNRHEEARTILEGVATEYHGREMGSESMASSFQSLAVEMKSLNMLKTARSVFSSLSEYYHSTKSSSSQASEVHRSLEETTEQLVQSTTVSTTSTTSSTETHTATDESTLTEVFESLTTMTSSTSSTRFASIIKTSSKLSLLYYRQQQWRECHHTCSQALMIMWPYFITRQGTVRLPSEYQREVVELALRMGECTWAQRQIEKTEDIYVTLFKATKNTVKIDNELYLLTSQALTDFYEQTYQIQKFLATNKEIYNDQKSQLGAADKVTIKTAYRIANYCIQQGKYKDAEPYLLDIWTALASSGNVSTDVIPAAEYLLIIYDQDARWESAEKLCSTLWETFTKKGSEARFSTDFVEKIYGVYSYVLQDVRKVSTEELYKFTKTYKETCQKVFGERNELTLKASLQFAQVCERSETHSKEALSVYEETVKHSASARSASSTTTTSTTSTMLMQSISIARQSLARMYTKESTSSETASKFVNEEYESTRSSYGATSQRSLESLSQLVEYNHKQSKTEITQQSLRLLQSSVVETIRTEKSNSVLIESAVKLAQSYTKIKQTETAWELLREIRRQVVTGNYTASNKFNISLEGTDRRAYTFIIAFSQTLSGHSATANFSQHMADLMTEAVLYQAYQHSVNEKAKFEVIFEQATRLLVFYKNKQRTQDYDRVWNELLDFFALTLKASKTSTALREFFEMVIAEIHHSHYESIIPRLGAERILVKMQSSKFQEAYEFATYIHKFVELQGGWRNQQKVEAGLLICLHLMGRSETSKPTDQKLYASIVEISQVILSAVLHAARDLNVRFIQMPLKQINDIVALLSEQQNYRDLEWFLTELWDNRHTQNSLDSVTLVWIGRRLVEVRFATGRREAAIHLCEDILYNVRRVWGPSDQVTVQMVDLLAELYSAVGDHQRALVTHEEMLRQVIISVDEEGEITPEQGAQIAGQELELMKRSFQRNGGFGNKNVAVFKDLYSQLNSAFGSQKAFSSVQSLDKWSAKEKADTWGVWQKPGTFEITSASQQRHKNHLKWTSGLFTNTATRHHRYSSTSVVNGS